MTNHSTYIEIANRHLQGLVPEEQENNYTFQIVKSEVVKFADTFVTKYLPYYLGFPVYGASISIELDLDNNELLQVSTNPHINLNKIQYEKRDSPVITIEKLKKIVLKNSGWDSLDSLSDLKDLDNKYWFSRSGNQLSKLVYVVENITKRKDHDQDYGQDSRPHIVDYVIDCYSGEIVDEIPSI